MRDTKRTRKPLTVARILSGSDRADLVERAGEVAQDPNTESMLLIYKWGAGVYWRNAGMSNEAILWATEVIKREMFEGDDGD